MGLSIVFSIMDYYNSRIDGTISNSYNITDERGKYAFRAKLNKSELIGMMKIGYKNIII
jgi:FAD synthase